MHSPPEFAGVIAGEKDDEQFGFFLTDDTVFHDQLGDNTKFLIDIEISLSTHESDGILGGNFALAGFPPDLDIAFHVDQQMYSLDFEVELIA